MPASTPAEFEKHGASQEIRALTGAGFIVVHDDLTAAEEESVSSSRPAGGAYERHAGYL